MSTSESVRRKKYPRAIANWPAEHRPREKLLLKGPESLSDAELLSIFLRVGVKGKNAIDLAQELLSRFGSLRELYAAPIEELRVVLGLGQAKIAQFKAVIEMSKRYLAEGFQNRPYVESSGDILKLLYQEMRDLDQEVFKVKRQIRAKQFTQDIIDTLGNRILEVLIPIPKDAVTCRKIAEVTRETVETRATLRNKAKQIALEIEGVEKIGEEDQGLLETI